MAAPPNTTPATATVMTMPYAVTLDVREAAAPTHDVWFTYTAGPSDYQMSFWAYANPGSNFQVTTRVYVGTPVVPHLDLNADHGTPMQLPLTPGETYWFQVWNDGVTEPLDSPLLVATARGQNVATVGWTIGIPDEAAGLPMVIYSQTGTIQQIRPFPAGEAAVVLPNGISLWHDNAPVGGAIALYDAALGVLGTTIDWTFTGNPLMTSNRVDTFYVGDRGNAFAVPPEAARVTTVSLTGVMGPTVWTLAANGLRAIGVARDETVLYYAQPGSEAVRRWDLVADLALAPLAAAVSGYVVVDPLLVLADATILVGSVRQPASLDSVVRRYAPDGTLLHTYALGAARLGHLTHHTDETSFWVWLHLAGAEAGFSRFQRLQVSDGTVLESFDAPQFDGGVYQGTTLPPPDAFGHSESCPFVLVPPLPAFGDTPEPSPHLEARYIRRLRRAPHVANEQKRVFYRSFELDLERGQALATGQGSDPVVLLRISRDGGQTWGEEIRMAVGRLGAYQARVLARRLGHSRDTVFEIVVSDPVAWSLVGAWLDLEAGTS
jgi:hypothetical protein